LAEAIPVLIQNSQKFAFYVPFLDGFPGFWHLIKVLQHFFSSLLNLFEKLRLVVIGAACLQRWIHLSTLSSFARPLHYASIFSPEDEGQSRNVTLYFGLTPYYLSYQQVSQDLTNVSPLGGETVVR